MIFHWLSLQGRTAETTRVYGDTRSWSKVGSAVSVALASMCVFGLSNYIDVFYFAVLPYILNIFNLLGYPKELDGSVGKGDQLMPKPIETRKLQRGLGRLIRYSRNGELVWL